MSETLTIRINSFSYHKSGIPGDGSGHGGGFVFDCRFLPNPGREEGYASLDGRDPEVIEYLRSRPEPESYWKHIASISDAAADAFAARGFTSLSFSFGCTGGQHRSVFFAERLFNHLSRRGFTCILTHIDVPER